MVKDKERSVNPAQQARKQEKNRALKKAKNEQQARRNEKLARRNPERVQRQIDDLKALESSGDIKPREKAVLADLERDLRAIRKAREALGEKAPTFGNTRPRSDLTESNGSRVLGKRGRDGEQRQRFVLHDRGSDSGGETDESVRAIPMPRDTPPPIPHEFRRHRQHRHQHEHNPDLENDAQTASLPLARTVEHKTTYSSAPQIRDLQKEATSRFVPSVVKKKQDAVRGVGGSLLEPEEMDRLEAAGYSSRAANPVDASGAGTSSGPKVLVATEDKSTDLEEEEAKFQQELAAINDDVEGDRQESGDDNSLPQRPKSHHVQIEDVEDEDL